MAYFKVRAEAFLKRSFTTWHNDKNDRKEQEGGKKFFFYFRGKRNKIEMSSQRAIRGGNIRSADVGW